MQGLSAVFYLMVEFDPTARDNQALQRAAAGGQAEVVELLLSNFKIDPTANNNYALNRAIRNGHQEVAQLLMNDSRITPEIVAALEQDSTLVNGFKSFREWEKSATNKDGKDKETKEIKIDKVDASSPNIVKKDEAVSENMQRNPGPLPKRNNQAAPTKTQTTVTANTIFKKGDEKTRKKVMKAATKDADVRYKKK